jgi:hypothetical protein
MVPLCGSNPVITTSLRWTSFVMIYRDAPEASTEVVGVITNLGSKLVSQSSR